ncbi:hypothetical protein EP837_02938 [Sphingobium sp. EP60837]|nr:hypothetical protein EP837_02938 [Sphingobium sp. EP60837]
MHFWQNNNNLHESQHAGSFAASNDHDAPQLIDQPVLVHAAKVDDEKCRHLLAPPPRELPSAFLRPTIATS